MSALGLLLDAGIGALPADATWLVVVNDAGFSHRAGASTKEQAASLAAEFTSAYPTAHIITLPLSRLGGAL